MNLDLRTQAIILRKKGFTYTDINKKLLKNIPKSTLSTWFKNLNLTVRQKTLLNNRINKKLKIAQGKAWQINHDRQESYLNNLKIKNDYLLEFINKDIQKLLLSILYLGEGAKSKSTMFLSLGNSNPKIILFYLSLLKNCFKIDNSKFRARIQCRADQDVEKLVSFWKDLTKIPIEQFYPTYVDSRTIGKPTLKKDYKGVCTLHYFDRAIQFELEFLANSVINYVSAGS